MDESRFNQVADVMLARIEYALGESEGDFDFEIKAGGMIEIEFSSGGKIIINRHSAAREIWVAARSGGYHFRLEGDVWINSRDGSELVAVLERCMTDQAGAPIKLAEV